MAELSQSTAQELAFRERLFPRTRLYEAQLSFGCRLEGLVPAEDHGQVERRLATFWRHCIETRTPSTVDIPGTLVAWAAPADDLATRATYIAAGVPEGLSGSPIPESLWGRLARTA